MATTGARGQFPAGGADNNTQRRNGRGGEDVNNGRVNERRSEADSWRRDGGDRIGVPVVTNRNEGEGMVRMEKLLSGRREGS
jgi:hypothetical protein